MAVKPTAEIELSVAAGKAIAALDQFTRKSEQMTKKLADGMKRANDSTKKTNESMTKSEGAIVNATRTLGKYVAGWMSVQAAVQLVTGEMQKQLQLANEARMAQLTRAETFKRASIALGGSDSPGSMTPQQLWESNLRMAKERGVDVRAAEIAQEGAFGAAGPMMTKREVQQAVFEVADKAGLTRVEQADDLLEQSMGVIAFHKARMQSGAAPTFEESLAAYNRAYVSSRATKPGEFLSYAAGVGQLTVESREATGVSPNIDKATAWVSTIGQVIEKTTGKLPTSGSMNFFKKMYEVATDVDKERFAGKDFITAAEEIYGGEQDRTTRRIQKRMADEWKGEVQTSGVIKAILNPQSEVHKLYQDFLKEYGKGLFSPDTLESYRTKIAQERATPSGRFKQVERTIDTARMSGELGSGGYQEAQKAQLWQRRVELDKTLLRDVYGQHAMFPATMAAGARAADRYSSLMSGSDLEGVQRRELNYAERQLAHREKILNDPFYNVSHSIYLSSDRDRQLLIESNDELRRVIVALKEEMAANSGTTVTVKNESTTEVKAEAADANRNPKRQPRVEAPVNAGGPRR